MSRGQPGGDGRVEPTGSTVPDGYDALPEAVLVLDAERRIQGCNDRARRLLEIPPAAIGQPLAAGLCIVDDTGADRTELLAPAHGIAERLAERVVSVALADGRRRPVAVAGRHTPDGGIVLTFRSAARRERLEAARGDLVATVSHEIRSPLTSVKGFTRTLLAKWERFSDEQKRAMLETVDADADRVTRLLGELLDVSRIDAGRVQLHRSSVDVGEVLDRVVTGARARPEGRDRQIALDVEGVLPRLDADPDKLEQILTNLVDNALRYADDSPVWVRAAADADAVNLEVADAGPGIPVEDHGRIFEKFGRGRGQRRGGSGLGLYITRGLAAAHGGTVSVASADGEGTTFTVRLPLAA